MKQCQPWDTGRRGDVRCVIGRAVPPACFRPVFLAGVLGIVDDQVRTSHELNVPLIARMMKKRPRRIPEGFVVGHVGDGGTATTNPVGNCWRSVIEILRLDVDIADAEKSFFEFSVVKTASQFLQLHREVRILHLARKRVFETPLKTR